MTTEREDEVVERLRHFCESVDVDWPQNIIAWIEEACGIIAALKAKCEKAEKTLDDVFDHLAEESEISPTKVRASLMACIEGKPKPLVTQEDIDNADLPKLEWRKRAEAAEAKCVELEKELAKRNLLLADAHRELDLLGRPCTCHPDDNPPVPCQRKYALTECRAAALKEQG